ncbi:HEAT repeat domain-containing protein [Blastopirellula sp. JC732]|uniref:HEAT repeat domain-containing protein n=1 Tax=Blastopirellula sediminis TaxID=2894196 RepID=A0A9X1MQJ5_9BACT|nr:HEAT repeat domain-containing protein [Blastopirellula sediminis]MCC9606084.1 HEAT repeat domain-containing protein [Blastopirellula sediminis]MCC9630617.1 HEAT repeat domain-containing protein [Blastopirellula sediminis]
MIKRLMFSVALPLAAASIVWADAADSVKALSGKGADAVAAADALARNPEDADKAVPALIAAMGSDDSELRWHAARALAEYETEAAPALAALTKGLDDPDMEVRAYSAYAIGEIGEKALPAVPALIKKITDKEAIVRRAAMGAVRKLPTDPNETLPLIAKILDESDPGVVVPALHTLAEAGKKSLPVLKKALTTERGAYWACLIAGEMGPEAESAAPNLAEVLKSHKDPDTRMQAAVALGQIGPGAKAAVGQLAASLEADDSMAVRYASAYALGMIKDSASETALESASASKDEFMHMLGEWGIARLHPEDKEAVEHAVEDLVEGMKSDNANVRAAAARCLAELDAPREMVAPVLLKALTETDPTVVVHFREAIVSLGPKATPRLAKALEIEGLRMHALSILRELGPDAKAAVPALIETLKVDDAEVQSETMMVLGGLGQSAAPATESIAKFLASPEAGLQQSALYALGTIGPSAKAAIPQITPLLDSDVEFTKVAAGWAIAHIDPTSDAAAKATIVLAAALTEGSDLVRLEAATSLGMFGKQAASAKAALTKAASDDASEAVRAAAAEALTKVQ